MLKQIGVPVRSVIRADAYINRERELQNIRSHPLPVRNTKFKKIQNIIVNEADGSLTEDCVRQQGLIHASFTSKADELGSG